jgi:hypothetical protein
MIFSERLRSGCSHNVTLDRPSEPRSTRSGGTACLPAVLLADCTTFDVGRVLRNSWERDWRRPAGNSGDIIRNS